MYIKKADIGGLTLCYGCPYFRLESKNIFSDNDLKGMDLQCSHHDICYRIYLKTREMKGE